MKATVSIECPHCGKELPIKDITDALMGAVLKQKEKPKK